MSTELQPFTNEQHTQLDQPLQSALINHRPGAGGRQLSYIKGKTAIDTANRIFGFGQWGYKVLSHAFQRMTDVDGNITCEFYTADIELSVVGAAFPFPGDGIGIVVPPRSGSFAESHEKARKEAVTDALKRALRHYGAQFGNDLYDEDAYVDAGDGTLITVKQASTQRPQPVQKRTVEAATPPAQIETSRNASTPEQAFKSRLRALYAQAQQKHLIEKDMTPEAFIVYLGSIINANISHVNQLTESRMKAAEAYIDKKMQQAAS